MEDTEKKRAKRRLALRIMSPEDQHPQIIECFRRNHGEPARMISMKISVYVEVFGETAGGRLLRLNNVQWGRKGKLRMQMIPARMSLDSIVQYLSVELIHIKDCHGHGEGEHREDRNYRAIQESPIVKMQGPKMERLRPAGSTWSREDHEDAHFFAFVANNTKVYGHHKDKWRKAAPHQGKRLQRIRNPSLSFTEYWQEHGGCWVGYGKG